MVWKLLVKLEEATVKVEDRFLHIKFLVVSLLGEDTYGWINASSWIDNVDGEKGDLYYLYPEFVLIAALSIWYNYLCFQNSCTGKNLAVYFEIAVWEKDRELRLRTFDLIRQIKIKYPHVIYMLPFICWSISMTSTENKIKIYHLIQVLSTETKW